MQLLTESSNTAFRVHRECLNVYNVYTGVSTVNNLQTKFASYFVTKLNSLFKTQDKLALENKVL